MNITMKDAAIERMKRDLQAGIEQFTARSESASTDTDNGGALQCDFADPKPTVCITALLHRLGNPHSHPASPATLERLALCDPDEVVRGLALLHLLQSPDAIVDPSLRGFAEERAAIADEAIEIYSITRSTIEELHASRLSLGRVAELTQSLTSRK